MLALLLILIQVSLLLYFCVFGFYNYLYGFASLKKAKFRKVPISGDKVAIVIVSYNEKEAILDTIKACEKLSYKNKVIIVGDDSNDGETFPLLMGYAEEKGCKRINPPFLKNSSAEAYESDSLVLFHRNKNVGYKAGNLKEMESYLKAKGFKYMYLLDADWHPQEDTVERCLEVLEADWRLAYVQTKRVGYHGPTEWLQRCAALNEEGCYYVDLQGRQIVGDPVLFTGCCTMFRLAYLYDVEGFLPGHLTEDIDLTNRLFLRGYKSAYLDYVHNDGEVPPHYPALRRQQERWTMGTARTLKEYAVPILKSPYLAWHEKLGMLRQNSFFTTALVIELSMALTVVSMALMLAHSDNFQAMLYRYYLQRIAVPYNMLLFFALMSNFVPPVITVLKNKQWGDLFFIPYGTWLSWSLLHTYFIGNVKGFLNIHHGWSLTPKTGRKSIKHKDRIPRAHHMRLVNFITLLVLVGVYGAEYYLLGWADLYAFLWIPALVTGMFLS